MHCHLEILSQNFPNYTFEKFAVGEDDANLEIIEYATSGLSSIKGLSNKYNYNDMNYDTSVKSRYMVEVTSLDSYLYSHTQYQNIILKIDTQGFELEVLKGAKRLFESGKIKAVIVEVMTIEKYSQSVIYTEIFDYLHSFGFLIFDVYQSCYEDDGSVSELDCVFIKY